MVIPLLTPFCSDGSVDEQALRRLVRHLINQECMVSFLQEVPANSGR
ncbi:MAG: hypothetical protein EHM27_02545 [Deltaproteobacteria bacterium]|nr:MAG: hypothetical protein EHM27_02545 [Deltaproteobacteria bacterium]